MQNSTTQLHTMLEWAGSYVETLNWHAFLVWGYDRSADCCNCGNHQCASPGKHPIGDIHPHGFKDATHDMFLLKEWIRRYPRSGLAIRTGEISNLFVIDIDGETAEKTVKERIPSLLDEPTPTVRTGNGNLQIYFSYPHDLENRASRANIFGANSKVDVRGDGGYVVAPPTSGVKVDYTFLTNPLLQPPARLPMEVIATLNGFARKNGTANGRVDPVSQAETIAEGSRHARLLSYAGSLVNLGLGEEELFASLQSVNLHRCTPPLPENEVRYLAIDVARRYRKATELAKYDFPLTDFGNAERIAHQHAGELRFVEQYGWMKWTGKRWQRNRSGALQIAKQVVRNIHIEAKTKRDEEERKRVLQWAAKCESKARIESMLSLAESEESILVDAEQFDQDPFLLNCSNGVIDLRTGILHAHDPLMLMTQMASCKYEFTAPCRVWLNFLDRILAGKLPVIEFLQRAVGYALTGITTEQCFFLCHGKGANGKSTFLETLRHVLGSYAQQADFNSFLVRNDSGIRNDFARMVGKRLVTAIEVAENRRFSESVLKQMTGGDTVTARFLFKEYFEFKPSFKVFLAANHKPIIKGTDHAIWRRIRLIPFTVTIPEAERDEQLLCKLNEEAPGILKWAVEGCLNWQRTGLTPPQEVADATATYRSEMDVLNDFINDCCTLGSGMMARKNMFYEAYEQWCLKSGEKPDSKHTLGSRMIERGFAPEEKDGQGFRIWRGIGLLAERLTH